MNIEYISLGATLVTAFIASWIAFHQMKTGKYQLKHDLFDRRMEVFQATHNLLSSLASHDKLNEEIFLEFINAKDKAHFLFSDAVINKTEDYYKIAFEHRYFYGFGSDPFKTEISDCVKEILLISNDEIIDDNLSLNGKITCYARAEFFGLSKLFKNDISLLKS
ncbi:hypothetical protein QUF55_06325 [Clostridiaceae bacterium HSG29]|nr:hypothetical protein [Clostridiaceae bacterium HSG29]